jgi:hypothetical protein
MRRKFKLIITVCAIAVVLTGYCAFALWALSPPAEPPGPYVPPRALTTPDQPHLEVGRAPLWRIGVFCTATAVLFIAVGWVVARSEHRT